MGITLKQIAEDLHLSKTTVSFVLSGIGTKKGIGKDTQKRILDYAKEHQYVPNMLAKSLYSGVSNTVGLIVPSISDMFYSDLAQEIELAAKRRDYMVMICTSERDPRQEIKMIKMLKGKQVDGLIIAPTEHCRTELKALRLEGFPYVLVDRYFPDLDSNYVVLDDVATTSRLIKDMVSRGRRKIALITTDSNVSAIYVRTEAYLSAISAEGLPSDSRLVCAVKRSDYVNDIVTVLDKLFEEVPDVDGFYFTAHYLALETLKYIYKRKIDMGRFSFGCIHYNPFFDAVAPGMEVARIPVEEFGECAMDILLANIKEKSLASVHEVRKADIFTI